MKPTYHSRYLAYGLGLTIVAGVALYGYLFFQVRHLNEKAAAFIAQIETKTAERERAQSIEKLSEDIAPEVEKLESRLVSAGDEVAFIEVIEKLGGTTGLSVEFDVVGTEEKTIDGTPAKYLKVVLSTSGSWKAVSTLLSLLETLPYNVEIYRTLLTADAALAGKPAAAWALKVELTVPQRPN